MSKRVKALEKRIANRKKRINRYRENIKKEKEALKEDEQTLLNLKYNEVLEKLLKHDVDPEVLNEAIEKNIKQENDIDKELR